MNDWVVIIYRVITTGFGGATLGQPYIVVDRCIGPISSETARILSEGTKAAGKSCWAGAMHT